MNCTICGTELHNGLDTYGDIGNELCQECWIHLPEMVGDPQKGKPYGVVIVEYEPDGKRVKSITYKIVESDDDFLMELERDDERTYGDGY